jgi:hypothetical protein
LPYESAYIKTKSFTQKPKLANIAYDLQQLKTINTKCETNSWLLVNLERNLEKMLE